MHISEFISNFKTHPILFIGSGFSQRYLNNSYGWEKLLQNISVEYTGSDRVYRKFASNHIINGIIDCAAVAKDMEEDFNSSKVVDSDDRFKDIITDYDILFDKHIYCSKFKIFISKYLNVLQYKNDKIEEIKVMKSMKHNIASIITTNYDMLVEDVFGFKSLIGNNILLSNPYGSVYKIHGCVSDYNSIIITSDDYIKFNEDYKLIQSQLISLFIHNPIIFIGYRMMDIDIKMILNTIFSYVRYSSELKYNLSRNFLFVDWEKGSTNEDVVEYEYILSEFDTSIKIHKMTTDNFISIYNSIDSLMLPISSMDIRKVQNILKYISAGGDIKVDIADNIDSLENSDKVLFVGSSKNISYVFQNISEIIKNYFVLIEEKNYGIIEQINKQKISKSQYFPIFGFLEVTKNIRKKEELKKQEIRKLNSYIKNNFKQYFNIKYCSIRDLLDDTNISISYRDINIMINVILDNISIDDLEMYIKSIEDSYQNYRILLCLYDYLKYSNNKDIINYVNQLVAS